MRLIAKNVYYLMFTLCTLNLTFQSKYITLVQLIFVMQESNTKRQVIRDRPYESIF